MCFQHRGPVRGEVAHVSLSTGRSAVDRETSRIRPYFWARDGSTWGTLRVSLVQKSQSQWCSVGSRSTIDVDEWRRGISLRRSSAGPRRLFFKYAGLGCSILENGRTGAQPSLGLIAPPHPPSLVPPMSPWRQPGQRRLAVVGEASLPPRGFEALAYQLMIRG